MAHKVLKPFDYADNGLNTRRTEVGEVLKNVSPGVLPGLIAEGYIADGGAAETLSKVAGEAMIASDLTGKVDSDAAVERDAAVAKAGISDGKIGAPEAESIIDDHKLAPLPSAETVEKAKAEAKKPSK